MSHGFTLIHRARRLRRNQPLRDLVRETSLAPRNFIQPLFLQEGKKLKSEISSLPGQFRLSLDLILKEIESLAKLGIPGIALFPVIETNLKDKKATESKNPGGLYPRAIREIKNEFPDMLVFSDVAMDPYSSDGHDGLVSKGAILNDDTLPILAEMALCQAAAGSDFIAPSDMMDGRIGYLRDALDDHGFSHVGILSYSAKYASSFYGPFRSALNSQPKASSQVPSHKKSYQMDPANRKEATKEAQMDIDEGADIIMVKPAMAYLDIISDLKKLSDVPVAAYQVSGEYAMIMAAAEKGWLSEEEAFMESLISIKRAGADIILSYYAKKACGLF